MHRIPASGSRRLAVAVAVAAAAAWPALLVSAPALAAHGSTETVDKVATVIAWIVICLVPIIGVAVFWMVHVLPEKVAHKRHHPQKEAIQVLCLLSLVFGGMLWPLAWLWAFSKPTLYKLAYGTDKSDEYYAELGTQEQDLAQDVARLKADLDRVLSHSDASDELKAIRDKLAAIEPRLAARASTGEAG